MKRTVLSLLLAMSGTAFGAAFCTASAASLDSDTPAIDWDRNALPRAQQALAAAQAAPGQQGRLLANALADLAGVAARQPGPAYGGKRQPGSMAALDYLERAQAIWLALPPDAALAQALLQRGRGYRNANHCTLALNTLESALAVADKAGGAAAPLSASILRELVPVAAAMGDDPTMNTLAPRLLAGLDTDPAPLAGPSYLAYLALADYYYRTEDNERAEVVLNRLQEKARAGGPEHAAALHRLRYELASVYYAQSRVREAQALLAGPKPERTDPYGEFEHVEAQIAEAVRAGRLTAALAQGQAVLARYEQRRAANAAALAQAQLDAANPSASRAAVTEAQDRMDGARRAAASYRLIVANLQGDVGELHHALGQQDQALALYEQSARDYRATGAIHLYRLERVHAAMALIYRARGDTARALALQQQVRAVLLPLLGARHPDVLEAEAEIAALGGER